jgi:imidazolonepropionase-like amidohydrolase
MRLTALRGRVVTDYEVWPEGTVLLRDGAIADVDGEGSSLADEADEVYEYPESLILPASSTCR